MAAALQYLAARPGGLSRLTTRHAKGPVDRPGLFCISSMRLAIAGWLRLAEIRAAGDPGRKGNDAKKHGKGGEDRREAEALAHGKPISDGATRMPE